MLIIMAVAKTGKDGGKDTKRKNKVGAATDGMTRLMVVVMVMAMAVSMLAVTVMPMQQQW